MFNVTVSTPCLFIYIYIYRRIVAGLKQQTKLKISSNITFHIIKSITVSIVSPSISHEVMGSDAMFLVF